MSATSHQRDLREPRVQVLRNGRKRLHDESMFDPLHGIESPGELALPVTIHSLRPLRLSFQTRPRS